MTEFVVDENSEGFKIGLEIGDIKKRILELPLDRLLQEFNTWETVTPFTDPTLYKTHQAVMQDFIRNLRILNEARIKFLHIEVDN